MRLPYDVRLSLLLSALSIRVECCEREMDCEDADPRAAEWLATYRRRAGRLADRLDEVRDAKAGRV